MRQKSVSAILAISHQPIVSHIAIVIIGEARVSDLVCAIVAEGSSEKPKSWIQNTFWAVVYDRAGNCTESERVVIRLAANAP